MVSKNGGGVEASNGLAAVSDLNGLAGFVSNGLADSSVSNGLAGKAVPVRNGLTGLTDGLEGLAVSVSNGITGLAVAISKGLAVSTKVLTVGWTDFSSYIGLRVRNLDLGVCTAGVVVEDLCLGVGLEVGLLGGL